MSPFLFVTDLDNTLVGDDEALSTLNDKLSQHRQEHGTKIVYATGRSPELYRLLTSEKTLLEPDALITSVGTEIYLNGSDTPDSGWSTKIAQGWNRDSIVAASAHFADLVPQPDSEQRPFKVSFFLTQSVFGEVIPQLETLLQNRGLDVKLIYSTGQDLDILPRNSDKGLAVQFLRQQWEMSPEQTVVCGDSGNDIALFSSGQERGVIVGNASAELLEWHNANPVDYRYLAQAACAGGILEGLHYFGFLG
ncbi:sucrose-phosphate phosphatase [Gloeocapsopsis crepidinum LEGE 06123]|uniref:sucrose-phosphate phosphatase n=1 Tax=Gloeocapsopsis crepidinum LEGE 06123 TaxID=588587 RepID=A0ABR9UMK4_9CHRO|nr:sucrose-phosphate phosphatase [Gloeocapsopsis crepidinum]MBE9189516.1 sucrose-phosphate phosphatase [Gloeocapsopsis crepidinum LEGE 06123]